MSTTLTIDRSIVPASVTQRYLAQYNPQEQEKIAKIYDDIKTQSLEKLCVITSSRPTVIFIAGSQGVGKSHMAKKLLEGREGQFVKCDVDSILKQMPDVKKAIAQAEQQLGQEFEMAGTAHYDANAHRTKVEAAVEKFRPAAKYISDRLMSECLKKGINVVVETNAKTPNIKSFINALKARHVVLEGHICEAPLSLKKIGAKSPEHGFAFPEDVLVLENEAFRKNIPVLIETMKDNITVWFRLREHEPAKMVSSMVDGKFTVGEALDSFDALFTEATTPLDTVKLFGLSRQTSTPQRKLEPANA